MSFQAHETHWNIAFSNSTMSHFGLVKLLKMSSHCLATTWNIVFSTTPKSHFGVFKTKKIISLYMETTWNTAFTTSPKSNFGLVKTQQISSMSLATTWTLIYVLTHVAFWCVQENEFAVSLDHLKNRFLELTQVAFWAGEETENYFAVIGDHFKHYIFGLVKSQVMGPQSLATTWNIFLSNPQKLNFGLVNTRKMCS